VSQFGPEIPGVHWQVSQLLSAWKPVVIELDEQMEFWFEQWVFSWQKLP